MAWGQLDSAVDNEEAKKIAEDGSKAFLRGAIAVQEAMISIDDGNLQVAAQTGLEATKHFDEAQQRFRALRDLVDKNTSVREDFERYLSNVDFRAKEQALNVSQSTISLWQEVQIRALRDGASGFFDVAAQRADANKELSNNFFSSVDTGNYNQLEESRMLSQIGRDLVLGAYISAVLANI